PKIELFARNAREGWACWGNQAPQAAPVEKRTDSNGGKRPARKPKKRKRLPSEWLRKPMPDCPLCEGKGSRRTMAQACHPCGSPMEGARWREVTAPCECVHDKPRPTIDQLKAMREEETVATEAAHSARGNEAPVSDPGSESSPPDSGDDL